MQRALEHKVRDAKWQYLAQTAAGQDAGQEAVKLKQARQALKAFANATNQSTADSVRTYVPGFGRSEAGKATAIAKKEKPNFEQYKGLKHILGKQVPETFAIFKELKYNNLKEWKSVEESKEQAIFLQNAPCATTPKKYSGYFLNPEAKHSSEFFAVGYTQDNPIRLRYDMAKQFDMNKATDFETRENGSVHFNIYMQLGVTEKRTFRTAWCKDKPDSVPIEMIGEQND